MGKVKGGAKGASGDIKRTMKEPKQDAEISKKKSRPNNFQRAKAVFDKIQEQKKADRELKQQEKMKRQKAMENYTEKKNKMNKALKKKTRKGQPNLGAQIGVILERLQKK